MKKLKIGVPVCPAYPAGHTKCEPLSFSFMSKKLHIDDHHVHGRVIVFSTEDKHLHESVTKRKHRPSLFSKENHFACIFKNEPAKSSLWNR